MFILVSVVERDITVKKFNTFNEAYDTMEKEFRSCCSDIKEKIADEEAHIHNYSAWVNDGNNHNNYDWLIEDMEEYE